MNPENNITPNKDLFKEVITEANLSEEKVRQELPNLDKEWKDDTIEPIKTATDQEKIDAYNNLETKGLPFKGLPFDWKDKLLRLKYLESRLADFDQNKEELKGWDDIYGDKKPQELAAEIKKTEEQKAKITEKLATWENIFVNQESQEINKKINQLIENNDSLQQANKRISQELNDWKGTWNHKELLEVKEEWDLLNKRPDLPITEQQFFDDYARRKSIEVNNKEAVELEKAKAEIFEYQEEIKGLWQTIREFLKSERSKRFVVAEPVADFNKSQQAIAELLVKTENEWNNYLQNNQEDIANQNLKLIFSFREENNRKQAQQILNWIQETKESKDYQKLFENWSGGTEYNDQCDFDGSLYLLSKYLEIKKD
jgi:hypothetical protein